MHFTRPLLFLLLSVIIFSCGKKYKFQKSYELEGEQWMYADSLVYAFDIEDTTKIYNLYLQMEHSTEYAYQNLYTRIHTVFPSGDRLNEQLSLQLANKTGDWEGKCGKNFCKLTIPIQENAYFNQMGTHTLILEQYMRIDSLIGIKSISFMLEETKFKR